MGGYHGVESDGGETTVGLHRVRNVTTISHSIPQHLAISDMHGCNGALRALLLWLNRDDFV